MEIEEITARCKTCGAVTQALVRWTWMTVGGEEATVLQLDDVPHSRVDCNHLVTLAREEWPTLW